MSRNFGIGTRDMASAGRVLLSQACGRGELSFLSVDTVADRWRQFTYYAKAKAVGRMERIDSALVVEYGRFLACKVRAGDMSPAYAQNLVSAINTVMALATCGRWRSISPTQECGIDQRCAVRKNAPGALDRTVYAKAVDMVQTKLGARAAAIVALGRELGLRSKESSLLDANSAWLEAQQEGFVSVSEGTKGGRKRAVPITSKTQLEALSQAAAVQGNGRNLIRSGVSWKKWREGDLRAVREIVSAESSGGLHDLRASYACERYEVLTGHAASAAGGEIVDRDEDRKARKKISDELGHGRIGVTNEYLGGRS